MTRSGSNVQWLAATAVAAILLAAPATAQLAPYCPIDENGRVANVFYEGSRVFFEPIVEYERLTLTVRTPCSTVVKHYKRGEDVTFDLFEVAGEVDGTYSWELRVDPVVDPKVRALLEKSRESDDGRILLELQQQGLLPKGPVVDASDFVVVRGSIVPQDEKEEGAGGKSSVAASNGSGPMTPMSALVPARNAGESAGVSRVTAADQVIPDDLIVQGSTCSGFDCVNGEAFGFDTIRLKENNLRIQFNDTSVGSFPTNNWQIRANSSSSGGTSFLGFVDQNANDTSETGDLVFLVEAGAPTNSLRVDSTGRVGLRKSTPVLDLHIATSNTPGIRLEQTSAGGFTAQTWDIAGNEANFFVRDVTGGSTLPFRIRPDAPTSSLDINANGNVGIGTASASRALTVVDSGAPDNTVLEIRNNGATRMRINNTANGEIWNLGHQSPGGSGLVFSDVGDAVSEMLLDVAGNMTISGQLVTGGPQCGPGTPCDLVFSPDFAVESIEDHAAAMWANSYLPAVGPTPPGAPLNLSERTGRILNELEKAHIYIEQLDQRIKEKELLLSSLLERNDAEVAELKQRNDELAERLARLESLLR